MDEITTVRTVFHQKPLAYKAFQYAMLSQGDGHNIR